LKIKTKQIKDMKQFMFEKIKGFFRSMVYVLLPLTGGGWVGVSCSDWDDHYEADNTILDSQQATLWENISKNANLSQFASLLKKAGYDEVLNASQTYTVWLPLTAPSTLRR